MTLALWLMESIYSTRVQKMFLVSCLFRHGFAACSDPVLWCTQRSFRHWLIDRRIQCTNAYYSLQCYWVLCLTSSTTLNKLCTLNTFKYIGIKYFGSIVDDTFQPSHNKMWHLLKMKNPIPPWPSYLKYLMASQELLMYLISFRYGRILGMIVDSRHHASKYPQSRT